MKKKTYQKIEDFDRSFDEGKVEINFSKAKKAHGMNKVKMKKVAPFEIPQSVAKKIDEIARKQGNSRSAVIRQILAKAVNE